MLNAVYTMSYRDVLIEQPHLLDNIVWDTIEHTDKLKEMLYAKYAIYEISGETIQEQQLFMETKFNQYKDYYAEMLAAYETEINWLDGEITTASNSEEYSESGTETSGGTETLTHGKAITEGGTDTRDLTREISETTTVNRTESVTTENYDLPRSQPSENRPSSKSIVTPDGEDNTTVVTPGEGTDTSTLTYGHTFTNSGTDTNSKSNELERGKSGESTKSSSVKVADLINQKERFLKLIRNLYSEFADKFKPCFLDMY